MQDVDSGDLVELLDAVTELKQRDVVHRHPERILSAQDLHLEQSRTPTVYYFHQDCELAYKQCAFRKEEIVISFRKSLSAGAKSSNWGP